VEEVNNESTEVESHSLQLLDGDGVLVAPFSATPQILGSNFRWHDHQTYRTPKGISHPFSATINGSGDLGTVQKMSQSY
jgi:hypothetical protein